MKDDLEKIFDAASGRASLADVAAKDWRVRAILRTQGRQTPMGALLLAILGITRGTPAWGRVGMLLPDGKITSIFTPPTGAPRPAVVCTKDELQSFLYGIVMECKLTDDEGTELYRLAQSWIDFDLSPSRLEEIQPGLKATLH